MPRLWAKPKGINDSIDVKTADFIMNTAVYCSAHVIVPERFDLKGCKHGSKKQCLHYRRAQYVQRRVEDKAHRNGRRVSRGCAGNTSKLAFEGFGDATRAEKNHSPCTFRNEKRSLRSEYYVQHRRPVFCSENLQVLVDDDGQHIAVKVPECAERNTCTLSSLIRLHAELGSTERQLSECSLHRTEAVPSIANEEIP